MGEDDQGERREFGLGLLDCSGSPGVALNAASAAFTSHRVRGEVASEASG